MTNVLRNSAIAKPGGKDSGDAIHAVLTDKSGARISSIIGNTPLLKLKDIAAALPGGVEIYAKAEHLNPGGSVKDRAAFAMISEGITSGKLTEGKSIIDATSGNTGIAYAMLGAALGYPVVVCLPSNASIERKRILKAYGAEIIETDALLGTDGAQIVAKGIAADNPETFFYPDQYNNSANWKAHYKHTASEIWKQTNGKVTHFVAAVGTSGTFVGTSRRLKELNPDIVTISVQPDAPFHGLEGVKHLQTAVVPGIYDATVANEIIEVSTETAQMTARRLAKLEGLFVGTSSGANVAASLLLAERLKGPALIVTILCDSGTRYLNEGFWEGGN
jgi:cysteine synthase B